MTAPQEPLQPRSETNLDPPAVSRNVQGAGASDAAQESALQDERLVRAARGGDSHAFDDLIEKYQQRATSVSYRLLGDIHDALETCQEAFMRAYQNLGTLEDPRRFRPWFLRIVTNLSLNFRRSRAANGRRVSLDACLIDSDSGEAAFEPASRSTETPGTRLAAGELPHAIREALNELTDQQRTALVLFSIEHLPQKEVASIMECSVEAVKWHVFQARKRLKLRLAEFL